MRELRRPTSVTAQSGARDKASVTRVVPSFLLTLNQLGLGRRHIALSRTATQHQLFTLYWLALLLPLLSHWCTA